MKTMTEFCHKPKIKIECEFVDKNPNMPDWEEANHYKIVLRRGKKQMTTHYSMGYGLTGEPKIEDILGCLANEASCIENAETFEDWACELGYDTDSRKAERAYNICLRQTENLKRFLSDDYADLLYNTERE